MKKQDSKKILLVRTPLVYGGALSLPYNPPVGIACLAEFLKNNGIEVAVYDMAVNKKLNDFFLSLKRFCPQYVGFSMMSLRYKRVYAIIRKTKEIFPDVVTIAGGPHISLMREQVLLECSSLDFGVALEGEYTLFELLSGVSPEKIKGLIYRNFENKVMFNGERPFISSLASLPFPKYHEFSFDDYFHPGEIPIVTSRGCPFRCTYCSVKKVIGKQFRQKSPESIIEEIGYWVGRRFHSFNIVDDNFTLDESRIHSIINLLEKSDFPGLNFSLSNGIRADRIDRELLSRMKYTGFSWIGLGVEGGNNKVLKKGCL